MKNDIHIFYGSGSGGHICAHLILQSHKHFGIFDRNNIPTSTDEFRKQFELVKQDQWCIDRPDKWKSKECQYDNPITADTVLPGMSRLFLTNGPTASTVIDPEVTSVLIYTDVDLQIEIAAIKRCSIFFNMELLEEESYSMCNNSWHRSYADVSEPHWPVVDLCNISTLPKFILDELQNLHHGFDAYFQWLQHRDSHKTYQEITIESSANSYIHGDRVFDDIAAVAAKADHVVKLQHIVQTRGKCLLDAVGLPWTAEHGALMDHWLGLHSDALQQKLLSKIG